jgi:hypothetical protein
LFQKEIGEVPTIKYDIEPVDVEGEKKYKLVVTGFQNPDQRKKLLIKKTTLKEEQNFEMRQMLVRAGIIK